MRRDRLAGLRIGFIGLGLMGKPMCLNLHAAGAQLFVHNRSSGVLDEIRRPGIEPLATPAAVAVHSDLVVLSVSDTPAVRAVLFGRQGLGPALPTGALVIDMGSTAVEATRTYAKRLAGRGVAFVDAPVSGGEIGAINGSLSIMAGGRPEDIERARPLFDVLGSAFTHIGDVGAGQVAKAANQVIVGLNIGAVAEALALAKKAGVDPRRVRRALLGGFAASRVLEVHGQKMIAGDFAPGAKSTTQFKDLKQAAELAEGYGLNLPATRLGMDLYRALIDAGRGDLDHSALSTLFE